MVLVSSWLNSITVGSGGSYNTNQNKKINHQNNVGLIAFGVGITECNITTKKCLEHGDNVTLIYANKTLGDVIFKDDLLKLKNNI
eukprot:UN17950